MPDNNDNPTGDNKDGKGTDGADDKNKDGANDQNLNNKGDDKGDGTDPKKTDTSKSEPFDPSKVGDEDFEKVFDDPRLFKHKRFKNLNDRAKKAEEYEKAEEKRKEDELKKKGEFEELNKKNEQKAKDLQKKLDTSATNNKLQIEAAKQGIGDLDAVTKLVDRSAIKVNDDGTVEGVEEAVKALIEAKPYLKGTKQVNIGSGSAPNEGGDNAPKRFKLSQLQDPAFFKEHEKEIDAAMKAGLIEDDTNK